MAFNANIPHACLISAKGVDHKIWGPEFFHPLFYMKIMGKKEQTIQMPKEVGKIISPAFFLVLSFVFLQEVLLVTSFLRLVLEYLVTYFFLIRSVDLKF